MLLAYRNVLIQHSDRMTNAKVALLQLFVEIARSVPPIALHALVESSYKTLIQEVV